MVHFLFIYFSGLYKRVIMVVDFNMTFKKAFQRNIAHFSIPGIEIYIEKGADKTYPPSANFFIISHPSFFIP